MKIVLATSNRGKIKEFKEYLKDFDLISYGEIMEEFEIQESGSTFQENALIKSRAVFERLSDKECIVLSDDSGISVPLLNNEPGIYSARYAKAPTDAKKNLEFLVKKLKDKGVVKTPAYYTACIALSTPKGEYSVHGWMHGDVCTTPQGDKGFGYDPIFIPLGYDKTLGELNSSVKEQFSHRAKALQLARILLKTIQKERL